MSINIFSAIHCKISSAITLNISTLGKSLFQWPRIKCCVIIMHTNIYEALCSAGVRDTGLNSD